MKKNEQPYDDKLLNQELDKLENSLADKIYYKIMMRHLEKKLPFKKSDIIIWKGALYHMPTWIGYVLFSLLFGWFFIKTYDKYGIGRLISYVSILLLWRLNIAIKTMSDTNKNIKKLLKKFN